MVLMMMIDDSSSDDDDVRDYYFIIRLNYRRCNPSWVITIKIKWLGFADYWTMMKGLVWMEIEIEMRIEIEMVRCRVVIVKRVWRMANHVVMMLLVMMMIIMMMMIMDNLVEVEAVKILGGVVEVVVVAVVAAVIAMDLRPALMLSFHQQKNIIIKQTTCWCLSAPRSCK
jgi:hypothetical protein